jgi:hypothetical protein
VVPSLTRGRVCNLLLLLGLAIAIPLGSESRGTQDHILPSQFVRLRNLEGPGPRIYIPQEVEVTLQLTVSQSVCQDIEPTLRLVTRYYFLSEGCCLKVAVLSEPGLTRPCICCIYIKRVTCKMGKRKIDKKKT